jgi:hypothetical protein
MNLYILRQIVLQTNISLATSSSNHQYSKIINVFLSLWLWLIKALPDVASGKYSL